MPSQSWTSVASNRGELPKDRLTVAHKNEIIIHKDKTKHKKEKKSVLFSYATAVFQENQQRMNVSSSIGEGGTLRICLLSEGLLERKVLVSGPELGCLFQL